jgi:hypothetical protein
MYQLIIAVPNASSAWFEGNKQPGDPVWVRNFDHARHLIENGICTWPVDKKEPGPSEQPSAGPSLTKPAEPSAKKSSGERTAGPSTVSPSSSAPGPVRLSSASAAALLPPHRR